VLNNSFGLGVNTDNIIVNLQGDEPELSGKHLDEMADALVNDNTADVSTLATPASNLDYKSYSVVKVVVTHNDHAMYFSRCPIPYGATPTIDHNALKHIGAYAYRREFFFALQQMEPTTLGCESLEQLQWLQSGFRIKVLQRDIKATGIDTLPEYENFVKNWQSRHQNR
jgi:3-deoxy-manno-octulosonate cytidylyltransferase (CMP-KDO synthetase)